MRRFLEGGRKLEGSGGVDFLFFHRFSNERVNFLSKRIKAENVKISPFSKILFSVIHSYLFSRLPSSTTSSLHLLLFSLVFAYSQTLFVPSLHSFKCSLNLFAFFNLPRPIRNTSKNRKLLRWGHTNERNKFNNFRENFSNLTAKQSILKFCKKLFFALKYKKRKKKRKKELEDCFTSPLSPTFLFLYFHIH